MFLMEIIRIVIFASEISYLANALEKNFLRQFAH